MSLIPLGEPRGDGPENGRDGPDDEPLVTRLLSGLRAVVLALPGASTLASEPASDQPDPAVDAADRDTSPDRNAPAALPGRAGSEVEVVSTEADDTLTVEAVDNPDATISSDTWEPIER
ncbi:hypothetical protein [Haloarcula laminariae]|uniref:hypothetical protein n=1 Tax=Haloarcula laminariae TaxID=2961577 RepID=UPI0021CACDB6|nr:MULTISPECIES: hypothetical protein [Halomicroarcula]